MFVLEAMKTTSSLIPFELTNQSTRVRLLADPGFILDALKWMISAARLNVCSLFSRIAPQLKVDREFVLEALGIEGGVLRHLSDLQADKDVVMSAVKSQGVALQWASETLRADRDLVMEAVRAAGGFKVLKWASHNLTSDPDIILKAVKLDFEFFYWNIEKNLMTALQWAPPYLRTEREFVLKAVKLDVRTLRDADESLLSDSGFIAEAMKISCYALQYAFPRLDLIDFSEALFINLFATVAAADMHSPEGVTAYDLLTAIPLLTPFNERDKEYADAAHKKVRDAGCVVRMLRRLLPVRSVSVASIVRQFLVFPVAPPSADPPNQAHRIVKRFSEDGRDGDKDGEKDGRDVEDDEDDEAAIDDWS